MAWLSLCTSMDEIRPIKRNEQETALWSQHLHRCPQRPAVSIPLPGCRAAKGTEERSSREEMGMLLRDLENHRSRCSQQRAPGSIAETTRRCPWTPLQPRTSRQSAARSCRTLLPTDAQPQARCRHVSQSAPKAIGANLGASSSTGTGVHAEAGTEEGTPALTALPKGKLQAGGH